MNEQSHIETPEKEFAPYKNILKRSLEDCITASFKGAQKIDPQELKEILINNIRAVFLNHTRYFKEGESRTNFEDFLTQLSSEPATEDNGKDVVDALVDKTVRHLSSIFNLHDFESLLQTEFMLETTFPVRLNRVMAYELTQNTIEIHVLPVITNNPIEIRNLVIDGFRLLAQKIKTSEVFNSVEKISGASWIVKEHPRLIESLGFSIIPIRDMPEWAKAEISKDAFLKLYG